MPARTAEARWNGDLKTGHGTMRFESGAYDGQYSFSTRFAHGTGTNPEELIAAAHAGCFSLTLAHSLSQAGFVPKEVYTVAHVHLEKGAEGFRISRIQLETKGEVPNLDEATFRQHAEQAKANCPVSKLLTGAEITLTAALVLPQSTNEPGGLPVRR